MESGVGGSSLVKVLALAGILAACLVPAGLRATPAAAEHDYQRGDLFVSVGGGIIRLFDSAGNEIEDLDTETASAEIGDMCFGAGRMYSMNFQDRSISEFDFSGNLIESHWGITAGTLASNPESCVMDRNGNLYVGGGDTGGILQKYNSDGDLVRDFQPEVEVSGIDETDLAADQCTLLYTSEGASIKAFDICQDEQLSDFATGLGTNCNNLRIRPNKEVLVACDDSVLRLSEQGETIQSYSPPDIDVSAGGLFALNLDNDGQHFFTATYQAGLVWRIDIESGEGVDQPYIQTVLEGDSIGGLAIFGEITVAAPGTRGFVAESRPDIVRSVPDPTEISTEPDVVGTNVVFAVIAAIVILLSAQIFNQTVEENNDEIEGFLKRYVRPLASPFTALRNTWRHSLSGNPQFARVAGVGVVLVGTALIYGFLEPGFSLDGDGILLVVSVVVALGVITYVYNGMEARQLESKNKVPAGVRVYPVAFAIAAVSVLLSRVISFQPGIVYGFVASSAILASVELPQSERGRAVFIAALCLLGAFGLAWAAMIPAREWAEQDANALSVVLEASATMIVVGAIETLAFSMVPLEFMHGMKVWKYNRVAWALLAIVLAFLFWHVLLVQDEAGFEAIGREGTLAALGALAFCVGITGVTWYYFYRRKQKAAAAVVEAPTGKAVSEATPEGALAPEEPPGMEQHPTETDESADSAE